MFKKGVVKKQYGEMRNKIKNFIMEKMIFQMNIINISKLQLILEVIYLLKNFKNAWCDYTC